MASSLTLIPAYGRDYKSKGEVEAAWAANKDFWIAANPGTTISKSCANDLGEVAIRYSRMTKVVVIKI